MEILNTNTLLIIANVFMLIILVAGALLAYWFLKQKKASNFKDIIDNEQTRHHQENAYKFLSEAIVILNSHHKIIYLNVVAEGMLGCKLRSVMGRTHNHVFKLLNSETSREMQGFIDKSDKQEIIQRECLLSTSNKQTYSIELTLINTFIDNESRKVMMLRNITERKALELQLSNLETYDTLTRMLTRKLFDAEIKQLIVNAHKHNTTHVLAYFSIDQFQVINDTIGYVGVDNLVINAAEQIKTNTNKNVDIIGRISANEFAVVFGESKIPGAIKSVQDILKSIAKFEFMSRGQEYSITMSCGFVVINANTTSSTRALSEANTACKLASKRGGNRVVAYREDNAEIQKLEGNLEWVLILKKALQDNRFRMHAQAIQPLKPGDYEQPFHHYELLIRLSDEKGIPISPAEFIGAAEYYSMMPRLDRWVIKNVFAHLSRIPDQVPLPVFAINLSGQSLNDSQFLSFVQKEIKSSGVHPQMLCFEITEQVAVEDLSSINKFIASLKALGCKFSLDDFGTGVSSYSYLRSLDVDYLKIDGSFVKHIANDEVARTMVQSISQVGHTMNLNIIAEYVENEQIMLILREMGVDYGQGYQIAKPRPIEEVIADHTNDEYPILKVVT